MELKLVVLHRVSFIYLTLSQCPCLHNLSRRLLVAHASHRCFSVVCRKLDHDWSCVFREINDCAFHVQVLSPIQALLFVVDAHPSRPDALALSNSVAFKVGRATEGCPKVGDICASAALPNSPAWLGALNHAHMCIIVGGRGYCVNTPLSQHVFT